MIPSRGFMAPEPNFDYPQMQSLGDLTAVAPQPIEIPEKLNHEIE
jgi:hypothetical protein